MNGISDKQSPRLVRQQRDHYVKSLAKKKETLSKATGKSQVTRLRLEIVEYERQIAECDAWLMNKNKQ